MPDGPMSTCSGTARLTGSHLSRHRQKMKQPLGHSFCHSVCHKSGIPWAALRAVRGMLRLFLSHPIYSTKPSACKWNGASLQSAASCCRAGNSPSPSFPPSFPPHITEIFAVVTRAVSYLFMSTALPQSGKNILSPLLPLKSTSRYFSSSLRKNRHFTLCWTTKSQALQGNTQTPRWDTQPVRNAIRSKSKSYQHPPSIFSESELHFFWANLSWFLFARLLG